MTTRESFEAEILKNKAAFQIIRVASGEYQSGSTQEIWEYWQAATAAERERCAAACGFVKTVSGTDDVERGWNAAMRIAVTAIRQGGAS